ncbi:DgyrCDS2434 [Dimorphilus gyrociliatus]|uniref:DgyrCDS2434 n=1 Tax=Dimorphilus gyrociliatus TaxID=2664684 RepID=A0A7I8VD29_9ANNE|nr:DgyrCDS2434 [Dimorphilus gyrociliatus]
METANIDDLKTAVRGILENKGILNEVKTKLRGEIFKSLQDESDDKQPPNKENAIINELIIEYLEFNNYRNTASLLKTESGQTGPQLPRSLLCEELNIIDETANIPLLYGLIAYLQKQSRS